MNAITYKTYTIRQNGDVYEMDTINGLGQATVKQDKDLKVFINMIDEMWASFLPKSRIRESA